MSDPPIDPDELIRDAYAVVAQPEKLFDLQLRIERAQQLSGEAVEALGKHIDQIGEMFDAIHLGPDADFSNLRLTPDEAPFDTNGASRVLVVDERLTVLEGDAALRTGGVVPDWVFGGRKDTLARIRSAVRDGNIGDVSYFRLYADEDDARGFMAQAQLHEAGDGRQLVFSRVSLSWEPEAGQRFADIMGLSEAERELTQFIVEGRSVADFAEDRGRSVGTARNQMKAVLRKLGIGSQSELVSLYAGFVGSLALHDVALPRAEPAALGRELELPDGSSMRFERFGQAGGKPVILLHGAIEGPFLTPNLQQRAQAAGLELFVPWMPFYSDRDRPHDPRARIEWFVERLDRFCDALKIDGCPILACSLSSAYGFAALKRLPDRFIGLVTCGFIPPLDRLGELGDMNPLWRAPLVLGRRAPGAVDMLVRAVVRLAMRGEAYQYFDRLLKDSPLDRATLRQPDVAAVVRKAFATRPDKAGRALAHALLVQALDWGDWLDGHSAPIRIVIGAHDVVHSPEKQIEFCRSCGFEPIGPLAETGGFSLFQNPGRVFAEVRSLYDG